MARQMVGQRKGSPSLVTDNEDAPDATDSREGSDAPNGEDGDIVKCPNCACEFNEETQDVVKPGKPVEGGSDYDQGPDLEQPQHPVPGRMGAAHDAAVGDSVMASLLSNLKGTMGGAR